MGWEDHIVKLIAPVVVQRQLHVEPRLWRYRDDHLGIDAVRAGRIARVRQGEPATGGAPCISEALVGRGAVQAPPLVIGRLVVEHGAPDAIGTV
ncbi:MAG: hypothetical protein BWY63_01683 [Chloroflexi bacterium ADurb.Bin360]|nr:MAG: hypothetical protein BWY63_01683 [Chloroflexi bacterium ADurb.Bin360]